MGDGNADRAADVVGPALEPGESASATVGGEGQSHQGHTDSYEVHKDESGNVTVDKWHHDAKGNWWK